LVTALVQSSSATTVTMIGFVTPGCSRFPRRLASFWALTLARPARAGSCRSWGSR
jgi:hypothetical protein